MPVWSKGASAAAAGATLHSRVGSEKDERLLFLLMLLLLLLLRSEKTLRGRWGFAARRRR